MHCGLSVQLHSTDRPPSQDLFPCDTVNQQVCVAKMMQLSKEETGRMINVLRSTLGNLSDIAMVPSKPDPGFVDAVCASDSETGETIAAYWQLEEGRDAAVAREAGELLDLHCMLVGWLFADRVWLCCWCWCWCWYRHCSCRTPFRGSTVDDTAHCRHPAAVPVHRCRTSGQGVAAQRPDRPRPNPRTVPVD